MRVTRTIAVAVGVLSTCLALTGTALADTTWTTSIGPVLVPLVPVSSCLADPKVGKQCVPTPPAQSVTLTVTVTVLEPVVVGPQPTVTPIACPAGTDGAAATISSGSATIAAGAAVTIDTPAGPVTVGQAPVVITPNKTVTQYACTGVS